MSRVLALDPGLARCGCAVSDPSETLATPIGVIERPETRKGLGEIERLVQEHQVERVVVGLALSLAGGEHEQAQSARRFARRLAERLQVPVELHDERFTTRLAEQTPGTAAADSRAAAHLLMSYLHRRSAGKPPAA